MTKKFKEYLESWTGEANKLEGKKPGWGDLADKLRSKKAKVSTDPKTQLPKTVIDHKDEHPAAMPEKHPKVPKAVVKEAYTKKQKLTHIQVRPNSKTHPDNLGRVGEFGDKLDLSKDEDYKKAIDAAHSYGKSKYGEGKYDISHVDNSKGNSYYIRSGSVAKVRREMNEETKDPYSLGYGHQKRESTKQTHPSNPFEEGSEQHDRWNANYEKGKNAQRRDSADTSAWHSGLKIREETELDEAKTVVGSKSFDNGDRYEMHVHAKGEKHEWASIIKTHQKGESLKNEHGGYTPYRTGKTDYINKHFKNLKEDTSNARKTLSDYIKKQQESNKPLPSIPSPAERRKQLGLPDPLKKEELEILRSGLDEAFTVSAFKSTPSETSETIKQKIKAAGGKIIHHARAIVDHPVFGHRENHTIYTSENGKKRVHYITNVNDTEQDVKYKKIGAVSTHQVRSAGKYDKPKNPNGGILNEENDAYTLGYGHFHRDLYKKPHPLNPHKQGTNDHKKWQNEYDLGKRDRRDEMSEEINTDERLPIGFKFKHDKPKEDENDKRLPIGTKTGDLKNKEIMRKGLDEHFIRYDDYSINWLDDNNENVKKIKSGQLVRATAHTKSAKIMGYTTPETLKRGKTSSGNKLTAGHNDSNPIKEETLSESKMSQLYTDIGGHLDKHLDKYKKRTMDADTLGMHCIKAHKAIAKKHNLEHKHAVKFVNDYVEGRLLDHE